MTGPADEVVPTPLADRWAVLSAGAFWGYRNAPGFVRATAKSVRSGALRTRCRAIRSAAEVYERALAESMPEAAGGFSSAVAGRLDRPARLGIVTSHRLHQEYAVQTGLRYGPDAAQLLDIWRRRDLPITARAPVVLFLPGGGWIYGRRRYQAHHMLAHLAECGWVCVAADYRVAPRHPWPTHIQDVNRVIAWVRTCIAGYGGDPGFIAATGTSAGGHLAALAGLTANDPEFRPDPGVDTSVDAVVSIYGRYDWEDRVGSEREMFMAFLERSVVQRLQSVAPETFRAASPIARVRPDAPPFMVIHGDADTVIPVEQARAFVAALRAVSQAPVVYAELPNAQHGFDMINNGRTAANADAIERFLRAAHQRHQQGRR